MSPPAGSADIQSIKSFRNCFDESKITQINAYSLERGALLHIYASNKWQVCFSEPSRQKSAPQNEWSLCNGHQTITAADHISSHEGIKKHHASDTIHVLAYKAKYGIMFHLLFYQRLHFGMKFDNNPTLRPRAQQSGCTGVKRRCKMSPIIRNKTHKMDEFGIKL